MDITRKVSRSFAILIFAVTTLAVTAGAQNQDPVPPNPPENQDALQLASPTDVSAMESVDPGQDQGNPAKRPSSSPTVGRLSLIHGDVSMQRGDSGDWSTVTLNTPLVRGDQVATGDQSRTEIQLDYANIMRLSSRAQVKIADLTRTHIQLQIAQGYTNYTVVKGTEASTEIDTPNVTVRPLRPGRYRVQVNSDDETDIIVRSGEAEVTTPEGSTVVHEGQLITIRGSSSPQYKVENAPGKDDWDRWNTDRDHLIRDAEGWRRTNRYYTGAHDLDAYGHWVTAPGYGSVWQPYTTDVNWAPYQTGRWVWEPYYGWTWVSYEPWGWAPYHYGRWFLYGGSWCWWPGPVYASYRPLWAPAYVFFFGFGHHVGLGFGSIGWLPVGPFDPYCPWYGYGFRNYNVVSFNFFFGGRHHFRDHDGFRDRDRFHDRDRFIAPLGVRGRQPVISNASLALTNARVRQSITSVPVDQFGRGNLVAKHGGFDPATLRQSQVMTASLPVVPTRESLRTGTALSGGTAAPLQTHSNQHFFVRQQPPAGPPAFHAQAAMVQNVVQMRPPESPKGGSGVSEPARLGGPTQTPASGGHPVTGATSGQAVGAMTTRGNNSGSVDTSRSANPSRGDGSATGWHRFGGGPESAGSAAQNNNGANGRQAGGSTPVSPRRDAGPESPAQNAGAGSHNGQAQSGDGRTGWHSFGSGGGGNTASQPGRLGTPADRPSSSSVPADRSGGWQRFPPNSGGSQSHGSSGGSPVISGPKPPLELSKPIVTPRSVPPERSPGYNPGSSPRYSPPSRPPEPRSSPPTASQGYGGGYRGGNGGGPSYGGGGHSGYSGGGGGGQTYGGGGHSGYTGGGGHSSGSGGGGNSGGGGHSGGSSSGGHGHSR